MTAEERLALRVAISEHHRKRLGLEHYTGNNRPRETRHLERDPCQGFTQSGTPCRYNAPRGEKFCARHKPGPKCEATNARGRLCQHPVAEGSTYCLLHERMGVR